MASPCTTESQLPTVDLERLSELILQTLDSLPADREALTPQLLSRALAARNGLSALFPFPPAPAPEVAPAEAAPVAGGEEAARSLDLYRRSLLTLIVLARRPENAALLDQLDRLKALTCASADPATLEGCLNGIKNTILREDLGGEEAGEEAPAQRPKRAHVPDPQPVRNTFLALLSEIQPGIDRECAQRLAELRGRLLDSADLAAILALGEEISEIVRLRMEQASRERDQVLRFVKELGENVVEVENQVILSLSETRESYEASDQFNSTLQGQMDDIRESFNVDKDLEQMRSFVLTRLHAIKTALASRRLHDEHRIESAHRKMTDLQKNFHEMKRKITQVREQTKRLEQEVLLDNLTGINNRRAYELRIREELQRYQRYGQPFSLVLFDIDHFKQINDRFGHQVGDRCLKELVGRIRQSLRSCDFMARYGGEEFIVILPGTVAKNGLKVAEKIRHLVEKTHFRCRGQAVPVTMSLGVTEVLASDREPASLFKRVDTAMYQAKRKGRNQSCLV